MYSDYNDFLERVQEADLILLIGKSQETLDEAIRVADSIIDSYLGVICTVPLSTVPAVIVQASVDIALYNLHSRIQFKDIPDFVNTKYENTLKYLLRVSRGEVVLPEIPVESKEAKVVMGSDARRTHR